MTDYKNELDLDEIDSILTEYKLAVGVATLAGNQAQTAGGVDDAEGIYAGARQRAKAKLEALLSQHSKKRELEAETRLLEYLATSGPKYSHAAVMD